MANTPATVSVETYYWMVDRLAIEDDTRNKVNMTINQVTLSKPFQRKIENGHYIGRLLAVMHPTFSKRSEKHFNLPASLEDVDPETPGFNQGVFKPIF